MLWVVIGGSLSGPLEPFRHPAGTPSSTSLGIGATYDLNDTFHLLGYVRTGLENRDATDRF